MRSNIHSLLILLLSFALVGFGVAQAGGLACTPACPQCKPVVQLSCCEVQPSMHQAADHDSMQEKQKLPTDCCHSELCTDLFYQVDEFAVITTTTVDMANDTPLSSVFENQFVSLPPKQLGPPLVLAPAVSLYTRNCSLLI